MKSLAERFFAKVSPEPNSGCWLWTGAMSNGRGSIGLGRSDEGTALAYRVSWQLHHGPIPDGMYVCHKCDVPACVNPDHLFIGRQADNLGDMAAKGRGRGPHNVATIQKIATKLDEPKVRVIKASDAPSRVLAAQFGVRKEMINSIRRGASWRHVS